MVNLNKIKRGFITITANKSTFVDNSNDVTTIPASYRRSTKDNKGKGDNESGVLLLFIGMIDQDTANREFIWTEEYN